MDTAEHLEKLVGSETWEKWRQAARKEAEGEALLMYGRMIGSAENELAKLWGGDWKSVKSTRVPPPPLPQSV